MFVNLDLPEKLKCAFDDLPSQVMIPADAYRCLARDQVEQVSISRMAEQSENPEQPDFVVAVGVVPYPSGIPVLMPGEETNTKVCNYLKALLQDFDLKFE